MKNGGKTRYLVVAFALILLSSLLPCPEGLTRAAMLSSIMSNIPTCALFASLGLAVLKANGDPKPGTSNLGKALMISIPAACALLGC